jgi:hypothetical protein
MFQMALKFTNIFYFNALKNLPKLGFWFEKTPSGNPAPYYHVFRGLLFRSPGQRNFNLLALLIFDLID